MRHVKAFRRLGMNASHRKAMMRNMVTSLIEHERIETTDTRAKEIRRLADRMVTLGKRGDLHSLRLSLKTVRTKTAAKKLFDELGPRFKEKQGGYTRIVKIGRRHGDSADMAILEWSLPQASQESSKKKSAKKAD
jgi:large subunit ribosomal protein L17